MRLQHWLSWGCIDIMNNETDNEWRQHVKKHCSYVGTHPSLSTQEQRLKIALFLVMSGPIASWKLVKAQMKSLSSYGYTFTWFVSTIPGGGGGRGGRVAIQCVDISTKRIDVTIVKGRRGTCVTCGESFHQKYHSKQTKEIVIQILM